MARVKIPFSVETKIEVSSTNVVAPVAGASVSVTNRDTKLAAPIYAAETGSGTTSPLTDEFGNIPGWLEEGSYVVSVSGGSPSIAPIEMPFDAVRGDGVRNIAEGAVGTLQLANESVTELKLAPGAVGPSRIAEGNALYRTGDLRFTAISVVESGWLACEGQAVSRTTYKNLYVVVGTTYGTGNGSTTFNVPNFIERVPMGPGATNKLGAKPGAATVALTTAQLAAHIHPFGTKVPANNASGGGFNNSEAQANSGTPIVVPGVAGNNTTLFNLEGTQATGGGEAHNNIQPSLVCNVWIKT
jgi:microcystin-dependent protein